jgi:uncharacterized membrane protein YdjX (TVP38/TMEM64 family)
LPLFCPNAVVNWLSRSDKFQKLDRLTEDHGAIIVALTRLVPISPFNLLNYGFGLTKVPFWTYVFWSWVCTLPGTILHVVGADAVTEAFAAGQSALGAGERLWRGPDPADGAALCLKHQFGNTSLGYSPLSHPG